MKGLDIIALILIIVGALNWGLIGFFGFNLVEFLFGVGIIATIVYVLVGISGLYSISFFARKRRA
ncbi:MAG: DUF378 domain-containing protein [Clostridium sp.]